MLVCIWVRIWDLVKASLSFSHCEILEGGVILNVRSFLTSDTFTQKQEVAFFASIRLRNGTFKTTDHHRLDDLNMLVIGEWRNSTVSRSRSWT